MRRKWITGFLVLFTAVTAGVIALADVGINEASFPDDAFREYVRQFDTDQDGTLSEAEIPEVGLIDCQNLGIKNLEGIRYFTELSVLCCRDNLITRLDLSENPKMYWVFCERNAIGTLILKELPELEQLCCDGNALNSLDISGSPLLCDLVRNNPRERQEDGHDKWMQPYSSDCWYELDVDPAVKVVAGDFTSEPTAPEPEVTSVTYAHGIYSLDGKTASLTGTSGTGLTKLVIQDTVEANGKTYTVKSIADSACRGMAKLTVLTIGRNVKTIGKNAFADCVKLKTVKGGAAVTTIRDSAFSGCKAMETFPAVSRLQTIGAAAFRGCARLTKFTLGTSAKSIGKNAFNGCKALKTITVKTTKLTGSNVGNGAFKGIYSKATFKCPAAKLKNYKKLFIKKGAAETCRFK